MSARPDDPLAALEELYEAALVMIWQTRNGTDVRPEFQSALISAITAAREALGDGWQPIETLDCTKDDRVEIAWHLADGMWVDIEHSNKYHDAAQWHFEGARFWRRIPALPAPDGHGRTEG